MTPSFPTHRACWKFTAINVKNTAITFEYNVPSLEEFRHRMKNITLRYPYIVLEADGKVMGYAYAGSFIGRAAYDWSCEMTVLP